MMATSALAPSVIDRLDAARALLGCVHVNENVEMKNVSDAQSSSNSNSHSNSNFNNISNSQSDMDQSEDNMVEKSRSSPQQERRYDWEKTLLDLKQAHEQSVSDSSPSSSSPSTAKTKGSGLDALAMLAMSATSIAGHGGDDDVHQNQSDDYETSSNYMSSRDSSPVVRGRARSASCPEGMDRWDAYGRSRSQQMHFTEPMISTILEEHQNHNHNHSAASVVTQDQDMEMNMNDGHEYFSTSAESSSPPFTSNNLPFKKRGKAPTSSPYDSNSSAYTQSQNPPPLDLDDLNSVAMSICSFANRTHSRRPVPTLNNNSSSSKNNNTSAQPQPQPQAQPQPAVIESPTELLRRTRARLLEDLNESNNGPNGEKGVLKMPHLLNKYKEMYNKNGRIGIYTPDERAAIIAKFNSKRTRRVWNKKIRYNCRKDLADRRVRVKGRFVKRSSEEAAAAKTASPTATTQAPEPGSNTTTTATATAQTKAVTTTKHKPSTPPPGSVHTSTSNSPSPSPPPGPLPTVSESEAMDHDHDHVVEETNEMDITDKEEAGYLEPTEDQPFRRTRRYTIT